MKGLYAAFFIAAMLCIPPGAAVAVDGQLVPVAAFFGEFTKDEAAAKQKYMNKRVTLEGEVRRVENSAGDRAVVFAAGGNDSDAVVCRLHKSVKGDITQITKGRHAVMIGTFSSFEGNSITLTDCFFGQFRRQEGRKGQK